MISEKLHNEFLKQSNLNLTPGQKEAFGKISKFISGSGESIFVLKGYAGTGKTTILSIMIKVLAHYGIQTILLAPTGRSAKVLSDTAGKAAYTIHKYIYRKNTSKGYEGHFSLNFNRLRNAVFIVDEASMINNSRDYEKNIFGSGSLIDDLMEFVFNGYGNKLILTGDTAQLPPVGEQEAFALSESFLERYGHPVTSIELTDITRQSENSGIVKNATLVRNIINNTISTELKLKPAEDFIKPERSEIWELIESAYSKYGKEETAIITVSNKAANSYNSTIRRRIFDFDEEITQGDILMVVKNNYLWTENIPELPFIANGDFVVINEIYDFEEKYGYRFADVNISPMYYPNIKIDVKLILDTLYSQSPSLGYEEKGKLYKTIEEELRENTAGKISKKKIYQTIMEDPYFNALEVKFAYAVTCHKAQGGQWKIVFVDQGHFNFTEKDTGYYKWLYTAITRAKEKVYLINFNDNMFEDG